MSNKIRRIKVKLGLTKNCLLLSSMILSSIFWFVFFSFDINLIIKCSESLAQHMLEKTCDLYYHGLVVGNLCPALCDDFKIRYEDCTNHKGGKISLVVNCDDVCTPGQTIKAMLKGEKQQYQTLVSQSRTGALENVPFRDVDDMKKWVSKKIEKVLSVKSSKYLEMVNHILLRDEFNVNKYSTETEIKAFISSFASLIQQNEYLISKLHQHSPLFPKIYQSCGSFYLTEFAPPGKILNPSYNPLLMDKSTWKDRVKIGLKLLDAVKRLDTEFHQTLRMCDVKGENFGLSSDGQLKIIDLDDVFYESRVLEEMGHKGECKTDTDCNILCECHGVCVERKCQNKIKNNNLQSFCKMVLASRSGIIDLAVLRNPPLHIKHQLEDVLSRCIRPGGEDEKTSTTVYYELRDLLISSVKDNVNLSFFLKQTNFVNLR